MIKKILIFFVVVLIINILISCDIFSLGIPLSKIEMRGIWELSFFPEGSPGEWLTGNKSASSIESEAILPFLSIISVSELGEIMGFYSGEGFTGEVSGTYYPATGFLEIYFYSSENSETAKTLQYWMTLRGHAYKAGTGGDWIISDWVSTLDPRRGKWQAAVSRNLSLN